VTSATLTGSLLTKATGRHDRLHYAGSPDAGSADVEARSSLKLALEPQQRADSNKIKLRLLRGQAGRRGQSHGSQLRCPAIALASNSRRPILMMLPIACLLRARISVACSASCAAAAVGVMGEEDFDMARPSFFCSAQPKPRGERRENGKEDGRGSYSAGRWDAGSAGADPLASAGVRYPRATVAIMPRRASASSARKEFGVPAQNPP
jgi:hypothetical protein